MELFADLKKAFRMTVLISGAVIAALFIYAVIVEIIKSQLKPFQGIVQVADIRNLRYLFYGFAILIVVLIRILSRTLLKSNRGEVPQSFIQKISRAAIIISVLAEIPALFGFVLFLLTGASGDFFYLLFVSLFLEFLYFPRIKTWQDMMKKTFPELEV